MRRLYLNRTLHQLLRGEETQRASVFVSQQRPVFSLSDWSCISMKQNKCWTQSPLNQLGVNAMLLTVDVEQNTEISLSLSGSSDSLGLRSRLLRKINGLKAQQSNSEAPDEFLCPITRELMKDPVMAAGWTSSSFLFNLHFLNVIFRHIFVKTRVRPTDGFSYERESMEGWIRGKNKTSPMTNLPLLTTLLTPNRSLKMAIERWTSGQ